MIDQLLDIARQLSADRTSVLIFGATIFGLMGGIAITCLVLGGCSPKAKANQAPRINGIRIWEPSKQRQKSLDRATENARLMLVVSGSIDIPPQRRRA